MQNQQLNCQQAKLKLEELKRSGNTELNNQAMLNNQAVLEHLLSCPACYSVATREFDAESLLSQALSNTKKSLDSATDSTTTPLHFLRTRVEERLDDAQANAYQLQRNSIMSKIFSQFKNRSRLSIGLALATVALLAVTVIPFRYQDTIGYEVAFAGVNKDLALDSDKITALLLELGVQGATVDVSGCETTCNLKITDLKSLEDGQLLIAAFESGGAVHLTNELTPIVDTVSGNFLTKAHKAFFVSKEGDVPARGELFEVVLGRLGGNLAKLEACFGTIQGDSTSFSINSSDLDGDMQWISEGEDGMHELVFFGADANGDSMNLHEIIVSGNTTLDLNGSGSALHKLIKIGSGDSSCNWDMADLVGFDFSSGQLTDEQISDLEAKGYTVTITQSDDGLQKIMLSKSSESDADGETCVGILDETDALAKDADLLNPDGPAVLPEGFALSQNYPNPFNPTTKIDYTLATSERVQIDIINLMGQVVRTLVDEQVGSGTHTVEWDATDSNGRQVASGMYFYRFRAGNVSQTKKMTLLK